jgi:phenylacetic acid degradation operon negative regulatory protein
MNVSAKSIILEILSVAPLIHGPSVPVRILVKAADVFEVAENSVRVAIVRLRAEGLVESEDRGQYQLGQAASPSTSRSRAGACWKARCRPGTAAGWPASRRTSPARTAPRCGGASRRSRWRASGGCVRGCTCAPPTSRVTWRSSGRACASWAWRTAPWSSASRGSSRPKRRAPARLWDKKALRAVYRDMKEQLEASSRRIDQMALEDAVREAFLVGREAVRWVVFDPLLPDELVAADERRALVATLEAYSDRGLDLWRDFLNLEDEG